MFSYFAIFSICLWLSVLVGCQIHSPNKAADTMTMSHTLTQAAISNAHHRAYNKNPLPRQAVDALMPSVSVTVPHHKTAEHYFDIYVNEAPAKSFFTNLAKDAHYNIVVSPNVAGHITLDMKHVTVQQVMQAVEAMYGYQCEPTSYGYNVYPPHLETRIFHMSYLNISRSGQSETSISSGQITNHMSSSGSQSGQHDIVKASDVKTTTLNNFWGELTTTLDAIVGVTPKVSEQAINTAAPSKDNPIQQTPSIATPALAGSGPSVIISPQSGLVLIKAFPRQLRQAAHYLKQVQSIMNRQVIIEAKILEVTLNADYQSGIDWKVLGIQQEGIGSLDSSLQALTNIFTISLSAGKNFESLIQLMQSQGRINVISSPRISTINNQKAVIKVGSDRFYITDVSTTTNTTALNAQIVGEDIRLTPFFSGVALDVTPEIDQNGEITLHLHPLISTVSENELSFTLNNSSNTLPSAQSVIRESDSIVRAKNNQIVVIGGLMLNRNDRQKGHVPIVSKVPGLGWFFENHQHKATKSEIVILLRPIIVNHRSIQKELLKAAQRYKHLSQTFSFKTKTCPASH